MSVSLSDTMWACPLRAASGAQDLRPPGIKKDAGRIVPPIVPIGRFAVPLHETVVPRARDDRVHIGQAFTAARVYVVMHSSGGSSDPGGLESAPCLRLLVAHG